MAKEVLAIGEQYQYFWLTYFPMQDEGTIRFWTSISNVYFPNSRGCKNLMDLRESPAWPQVRHNEVIVLASVSSTTRNLPLFEHTIPQQPLIRLRHHYQKSTIDFYERIGYKVPYILLHHEITSYRYQQACHLIYMKPDEEWSERLLFLHDTTELCDASFNM